MTVVADTGDCLFAAVELRVHERTEFLASAFYTTMGFAVPAGLGAQAAVSQRSQPLIINVHLARDDASPAMRRLAEHLGRQVSGGR